MTGAYILHNGLSHRSTVSVLEDKADASQYRPVLAQSNLCLMKMKHQFHTGVLEN